jgi:ferredoxin-NADP reductase
VLEVPGWAGHVAGQNVDGRLTAEDGYQAERSYAIVSAAESAKVALTVERIDDGEVSSHLAPSCGEVAHGRRALAPLHTLPR